MYIVFQINGGIGKCVLATAVCKAITKKFPKHKIIVVSGYPEVFIGNPYVYKSLSLANSPYFYKDYVENKDTKFLLHDPYMEEDYIYERKHLIQTWCEMNDIPYNGELPELFLTKREKDYFQRNFKSDKPIMFMQTNGGANDQLKYSWARDIPYSLAIEIVKEFSNEYIICHVRRDDQLALEGTIQIKGTFREMVALVMLSSKRVLMDSFLQHVCGALNLPSTVLWIVNNPKVLGYEIHNNIQANTPTTIPDLRSSYIAKYNIGGEPMEFPYDSEDQIFTASNIIESIKNF
jgi:hypothetical protein